MFTVGLLCNSFDFDVICHSDEVYVCQRSGGTINKVEGWEIHVWVIRSNFIFSLAFIKPLKLLALEVHEILFICNFIAQYLGGS